MIQVNKPFFPPFDEFTGYLKEIWEQEWVTNNGPFVKKFEMGLQKYLDVPFVSFVSNGTIALQLSIKSLGITGEVITTPFSFIATSSSLSWEGCEPVYADIDPLTLNIDPLTIEPLITPRTSAILATHVYGHPCEVEKIKRIAQKHNLKIIYDAAHCFGSKLNGKSLYAEGDLSIASFHATKVLHSIEGGAIFARSEDMLNKINGMRNFGFAGPYNFKGLGINGKNSEVHAAMGCLNLKYIDFILEERKKLFDYYIQNLDERLFKIHKPVIDNFEYNFSYFPVIFDSEELLSSALAEFQKKNVGVRRYFYPSLNTVSFLGGQKAEVSEEVSKRVLCLPFYSTLRREEIDVVCEILNSGRWR